MRHSKTHTADGVMLSDEGLAMIKSMMPEPLKRTRAKRGSKMQGKVGEQEDVEREKVHDHRLRCVLIYGSLHMH